MKILVIDNYDSFTYNLVQYFGELGVDVLVYRNDALKTGDIKTLGISAIVISPGPSTPAEAGISVDVIKQYAGVYPLFGVCLGHQAIGYAFGARIVKAQKIYHGKTSLIHHDGNTLFSGLDNPFTATRYHSLVIDRKSLSGEFIISAESEEDHEIMAIRHKKLLIESVQFHPESILTADGKKILANFINMIQ
ncbi:MAG: aminodeoxychorismate/anthranilate synthase component II [Deltaproteobacteria bacterium]|nr:aminodeoxychorismate/anthranilate synthase component II [Deltaproteobacteria bacterium]